MRIFLRKATALMLVAVMLFTSLGVETFASVRSGGTSEIIANGGISPAITTSLSKVGAVGVDIGVNTTLLAKTERITIRASINPGYNSGRAEELDMTFYLPYFYYDAANKLVSTTNLSEVPESQRDNLMGVEAEIINAGDFTTPSGETQNLRGEVKITNPIGVLYASSATSVELAISFYGDVPENAQIQIEAGSGYKKYIDDKGNINTSGYEEVPGDAPFASYTLINTNLVWNVDIEQLSKPVLWDRYNYIGYKVKISNDSTDEAAIINNASIAINPDNFGETPNGIFDSDVLVWTKNDDGTIEAYDYEANLITEQNYIGKPQAGGALVWETTNKDTKNWDFIYYRNDIVDLLTYHYTANKDTTVSISGEPIRKGESKEFYIAIPAQTNISNNLINVDIIPSVIYENGVTWSKPFNRNFSFAELKPEFLQDAYLRDKDLNKVDSLAFDDDEITSIYLDNFTNKTNTPVFNAYALNTLPKDFDLKNIIIKMEKPTHGDEDVPLSEWFLSDGSDVVMGVFEKNGIEKFLPLGTFAEINTNAQEQTYWQLDPTIGIKNHEDDGYTFTNKIVYNFKKRIETDEGFKGEIEMQGHPSIAFESRNDVITHYETWTYSPQSEDPVTDDDYVAINQKTEIETVKLELDPGVPAIQVESYQLKDGAYIYGETTKVSLEKADVGFRYTIGNTGNLAMPSASFSSGTFIGNNFQFDTDEIIISKGLLENVGIESIVFNGSDSKKKYTLSGSVIESAANGSYNTPNLYRDAEGNVVIKRAIWVSIGSLYNISVELSNMDDIGLDANNYIKVDGRSRKLGDVIPTGTLKSNYEDPSYVIERTDTAALVTNDILIIMSGQSRDDVLLSDKNITSAVQHQLTVPNQDEDTGYKFEFKNDSEANTGGAELNFDLLSVGVKNNAGVFDTKIIKGFQVDDIVISSNHADVGRIKEIEFFQWDQDGASDTPKVVLTAADLGIVDGESISIDKAKWIAEIDYLKEFNIIFEDINGNELAVDRETLVVDINGTTDWYDNLDATMTFTPDSVALESKIATVPARLHITRPYLEVQTNIEYEPIKEVNLTKAENWDKTQTTLGIPYDRDFKYRVNARNTNVSMLDDIDLFVMPPISKEGGTYTGYHATKILISKAIIEDITEKESISITLFDVTDLDGEGVTLNYHKDTDTFKNDDLTISLVTDPADPSKQSYEITAGDLETLGIEELGKLLLTGKEADYRNADPNEFYIDFYGYLDSYFGTSNIINAEGHNYLDGIREARYQMVTKDSSNSVVSKMYFDTVLTAGYQDKPDVVGTDSRFDKETTSIEQVRSYYRFSTPTPFYDNSELETGYKSMGSFMLDFRQYLDVNKPPTGGTYPLDPQGYIFAPSKAGEDIQEHEEMPWIYTESMNTALNVETTLDLPDDVFDAYYLKVDPRAIDYIKAITVFHANGDEVIITEADIAANKGNGAEIYNEGEADEEKFFRINLLNTADGEIFKELAGTDYDNFYEETDSKYQEHATHSKIDKIIFNLDINEDQQNDSGVNQDPDFSTWYKADDPETKYMFEVTGRYYDVGEGTATATTQLVAGGDRVYDEDGMADGEGRSLERSVTGDDLGYTRSDWSWVNYYRYWYPSGGSWYTGLALYDSAHLKSRTNIIVKDDGTGATIGANDNLATKKFEQAIIGDRYVFPIAVYRTTPEQATYEVEANASWRHQDANDWENRISYTDYNTLTATLPKIRQDDSGSHYGFFAKDLEINGEILQYTDEIIIYERLVEDNAGANAPTPTDGMVGYTERVQTTPALVIKKEDFSKYNLDVDGTLKLEFKYEELGDTEGGLTKNQILFDETTWGGYYPDRIVIKMSDLDGQGDYAREYMNKTDLDTLVTLGTPSETDIRIGGEVYSTKEINPVSEATTNIRQVITYDDGGTGKIVTDAASMQGFRLPFQGGYSITAMDSGVQYVYQPNNLDPTVSSYKIDAWNREDGATLETQSATIDEITIRNIFSSGTKYTNSEFNIKKLYIPDEFISGTWFGIAEISFLYNGQQISLSKDGTGDSALSKYLVDEGDYQYVDIDKVISTVRLSTFDPKNTTETYINEHVSEFTIKTAAVSPGSDPKTLLDGGQYLTSDKTKDGNSIYYEGVWVNRSEDDFENNVYDYTSRPTFDMHPNNYGPQNETTNIIGTFNAFSPNADDYAGDLTNTKPAATYAIENLVGVMVVDIFRGTDLDGNGTVDTFAYDKEKLSDGTEKINKIHNGNIMPFDYLDYTLKLGASSGSAIPLQQSEMTFTAPDGMRIIGWEIKGNNTGINNSDITATATDRETDTPIALDENKNYFYGTDNATLTTLKELTIVVGNEHSQIPKGTDVEIIVHTQITDDTLVEDGQTLEGHQFNARYDASAKNRHTYGQYRITTESGTITAPVENLGGYGHKDAGIEGVLHYDTYYYRNLTDIDARNTSYVSTITSRTSVAYEDELLLTYIFDDLTAQYDNQAATITVVGKDYHTGSSMDILNDSDHNLKEYALTISFLQNLNGKMYQDFTMQQMLKTSGDSSLEYIVKNPENIGHSKEPTIEYEFKNEDGTTSWIHEDDVNEMPAVGEERVSTEKYVDESIGVRIVWYDIPAKGTDGENVVLVNAGDPVELKGIGRYHRTTPSGGTTFANDTYDMRITATTDYIHNHLEKTTNTDGTVGKDFGVIDVDYEGAGNFVTLIRRERPVLTLQTQIFETEAEAEIKYNPAETLADEQQQKIGYRPDDGLWYKFYVENYKVTTPTNTEPQGVLLNPVFYDKIPVYVDIVGSNNDGVIDAKDFVIRWYDEEGNLKPSAEVPELIVTKRAETVTAKDFGGDTIVRQNDLSHGNTDISGKLFADISIDYEDGKGNVETNTIEYSIYEFTFPEGTRLEVGEAIEIYYEGKINADTAEGLPLVYSIDGDKIYPEYYPKIGEYRQNAPNGTHNTAYPFTGHDNVNNETTMMDMNYLYHDVGVSGTLNPNVDRWEYLKDSTSYIPGSGINSITASSPSTRDDVHGDTGTLVDYDVNPAYFAQDTIYKPSITFTAGITTDSLPTSTAYTRGDKNRDIYNLLLRHRYADNHEQNWDGQTVEVQNPVLWASSRTHLQAAWLATSSEIIPHSNGETGVEYTNNASKYLPNSKFTVAGNPSYGNTHVTSGASIYKRTYGDDSITTLEYKETYTTRLGVYNYGDWGVDGVELTYTLPAGMEPELDDEGNLKVNVRSLTGGRTNENPTYTDVDSSKVTATIIQTPDNDQNYRAPQVMKDPLLSMAHMNTTGDSYVGKDTYYGDDVIPYVVKIVIEQSLDKWFYRGSEMNYLMYADLACNVSSYTDTGYWYDQIIAKPLVTDSGNHEYSQIYDMTVYQGDSKEDIMDWNFSSQKGGMDHWTRVVAHANPHGFTSNENNISGSPNMPYIDGFNIQNEEVLVDTDVNGIVTNIEDVELYRRDQVESAASTGTRAMIRKPLVRVWNTLGEANAEGDYGTDLKNFYLTAEINKQILNIHLENNYYWNDQSLNGHGYAYHKHLHNYSTDGGNEGTLYYPVIQNILPKNFIPVAEDGTWFTTDNAVNATMTLKYDIKNLADNADMNHEKTLYNAEVEFVEILNEDGKLEGRYQVNIYPKSTEDGKAKLANGEGRTYNINFVTTEGPDAYDKDGSLVPDLEFIHQSNITLVSSQLDNYKFLTDNDIAGNPFTVGATWKGYQFAYRSYYNIGDTRKDAVVSKIGTYAPDGYLPNDLRHLLGKNFPVNNAIEQGGVKRIYEGDELEIETFLGENRSSAILANADFNLDGAVDTTEEVIMTGVKPFVTLPYLYVESYVSTEDKFTGSRYINETTSGEVVAKEGSISTPTPDTYVYEFKPGLQHLINPSKFDTTNYTPVEADHLQYGDLLWYTTKVVNSDPLNRERYDGDINHAKMVVAIHLPAAAKYLDDYQLSFSDGINNYALTKEELESTDVLENKGWDVKLVEQQLDATTQKEILVFEIITPGSIDKGLSKEEQYLEYLDGETFDGHFADGSQISIKVKAKVNPTADIEDTEKDYWDNSYNAQSYVTFKDTAGSFLGIDKLNSQTVLGEIKIRQVKEEDTDFDLDGDVSDQIYISDKSARISVMKPSATARTDTGIKRHLISLEGAVSQITLDTSIKSGGAGMVMYLDEFKNVTAPVSEFIVDFDIGYKAGLIDRDAPVTSNRYSASNEIMSIRTGVWEIPEDYSGSVSKATLEKNLKVHVYVRVVEDTVNTDYEDANVPMDSRWKLLGKYPITQNEVINASNSDLELYDKNILQVRYVIKSEGDPITDLVPEGFRLSIDANGTGDGVLDMDDIDEKRVNIESLPTDVINNAAFVHINTVNSNLSAKIHVNHYVDTWGSYGDGLVGKLSETAHAGYYIDAEAPSMRADIDMEYLLYSKGQYAWNDKELLVKDSSSVVKYKTSVTTLTTEEIREYEEREGSTSNREQDILSNPQIVVALPKVEGINEKTYGDKYIDTYSSKYAGSKVHDDYVTNSRLYEEDMQWTWYVEDRDGNKVTNHNITDLDFSINEDWIAFTDADPGAFRTLLNFDFTGYLRPGETLVVDTMVWLNPETFGTVSTDSLITTAYVYKEGSYSPVLEDGSGDGKTYGYRPDQLDVNDNDVKNAETHLTASLPATTFDAKADITRNKYSYSEYDQAGLKDTRPALVPEGTIYSFKTSIAVRSSQPELYEKTMLYDVLPHVGDRSIINTESNSIEDPTAVGSPRNSTWSGWVLPETIRVTKREVNKETPIVDGVNGEIWVGPYSHNGTSIIPEGIETLPAYSDTKTAAFYEGMYDGSGGYSKDDYFIRLSSLLELKDTDMGKYRELSKNMMAIWVQLYEGGISDFNGNTAFELDYSLEAPLNIPHYQGVSLSSNTDTEVLVNTAEFQGWNTYSVHASYSEGGGVNYFEAPRAGVFPAKPADKGYIGSYVWYDEDFDATIDEGRYTRREDGRLIFQEKTKDLDFDGTLDDPGINDVVVELLTEAGYPSNKLGQAVVQITEGGDTKYILVDEKTGQPEINEYGLYNYTLYGPVQTVTKSDAYGNEGYFIISNIDEGNYKLRYSFPYGDYNVHALTTKEIGHDEIPMDIYRSGETLPDLGEPGAGIVPSDEMIVDNRLVVQTSEAIRIEAIGTNPDTYAQYDEKMTSYNVGVSRDYVFSGIAWNDQVINGLRANSEELVENVKVKFYEINLHDGSLSEALNTDWEVAETVTDVKGYFEVSLIPGRHYVAIADTSDLVGEWLPTPFVPNSVATSSITDNDLYTNKDEKYETTSFNTKFPKNLTGEYELVDGKYVSDTFIGLGLIQKGAGFIGGNIWNDINYDGIRSQYYNDSGDYVFESGYENVSVLLEQYYYSPDTKEWILSDENFGTTTTSNNGTYIFQELPSEYVDGLRYLAGYKIKVDLNTIPDDVAITKFQTNKGVFDSDLPRDSAEGYLTEYGKNPITIAEITNEDTMEFDPLVVNLYTNVDAGFKEYEPGYIEGVLFFDKNGNGYKDTSETFQAFMAKVGNEELDFTVNLESYYADEEGKWHREMDGTGAPVLRTATVDKTTDGTYSFDNLPVTTIMQKTITQDDGTEQTIDVVRILGYKVKVSDNDNITASGDIYPTFYMTNKGLNDSSMFEFIDMDGVDTEDPTEGEEPATGEDPTTGVDPDTSGETTTPDTIPEIIAAIFEISKNKEESSYKNGEVEGYIVFAEYTQGTTRRILPHEIEHFKGINRVGNFDVVAGKDYSSYNGGFTDYKEPTPTPIPPGPGTGDDSPLLLLIGIMLASGVLIGSVFYFKGKSKKQRNKEE